MSTGPSAARALRFTLDAHSARNPTFRPRQRGVGLRAVAVHQPDPNVGGRANPTYDVKSQRSAVPVGRFRPRGAAGGAFLSSLAHEGAERRKALVRIAAPVRAITRHAKRHLARRLAPSDVGRSPPGAPPRHLSTPGRACGVGARGPTAVQRAPRSQVVSARVAGSGVARVRECKSRPQAPLPAPPLVCLRRRPRTEPG